MADKSNSNAGEQLPAPLVPAEVDLRDFAFMPLDVRRLRDSRLIAIRKAEEVVAAIMLWSASWHQQPAASLPDDAMELSQLAGCGRMVEEFNRIRDGAMHGLIKCSDGRWYHPVVAEKAAEGWNAKIMQQHKRACDRQRKENKDRIARKEEEFPMPEHPPLLEIQWQSLGIPVWMYRISSGIKTISAGIPEERLRNSRLKGQGQGQGQGQGSTKTTPRSKASVRGCRLEPEWEMPQGWIGWAMGEQPTWFIDHAMKISKQFKDYWIALPGQRGVKLDWEATWRNWVRKEKPMPGYQLGKQTMRPPSATAQSVEILEGMKS